MTKLAILASGSGSNAEAIMRHFKNHASIEVSLIISNKETAGVFDRAEKFNIKSTYLNSKECKEGTKLVSILQSDDIEYIILAGFLLKIPRVLINVFPKNIVNIHPALLPKYGGKGMYGIHVHKAVLAAQDQESGPTIHLVNEQYDEGQIIAQFSTDISMCKTASEIQTEVLKLEHKHFATTIEQLILDRLS